MINILSNKELLNIYKNMVLARRTEDKISELFNSGELRGSHHASAGHEAIAAAVSLVKKPGDVVGISVRAICYFLANGGDARGLFAELFGKTTGYNKGFSGSMHLNLTEKGLWGVDGVLGNKTAIVTGFALSCKLKGKKNVAISTYGDGAANTGLVHESMNMAAIWKLPIVFLCENNQYAVTTSVKYATAIKNLSTRAIAYGFEGVTVDGMDVEEIYLQLKKAVDKARSGGGPTLVECVTYRYQGHSLSELRLNYLDYRSDEEMKFWKEKDPIINWRNKILQSGKVTSSDLQDTDNEVEEVIRDAVGFARKSPLPSKKSALDYMYASKYKSIPAKGW
jgi:TPP-dependent pyruvate/acetoin dehydrogenase alpha subunit